MSFRYDNQTPPRKLYKKYRVADGVILSPATNWPNAVDDSEIIGSDGSVKFLAIDEDAIPQPPKDYDSRYFFVTTTEGPEQDWQTNDSPSYFIRRELTKRPAEEIKSRADNEELLVRNQLAPPAMVNGDLAIIATALARQIQGLSLVSEEQEALNRCAKVAAVFLENKENLKQKHAAIDLGQEPDLSAGYKSELAE